MNLQDLLPEIIFQICELLCQHCAEDHRKWPSRASWSDETEPRILRQALLDLSLLCKSWGSIAQKVLHHHFGFLEKDPTAQVLFCRTISENPELAQQLKHAELHHIETALDKTLAEGWINDVLDRFSSFITFDVETSRWEEFVAPLILLQVPNLKHLVAEGKNDWMFFEKFNKQTLVRERPLPRHLKAISVGKCVRKDDTSWFPIDLSKNGFGGVLPAFEKLQQIAIWSPDSHTIRDPLPLRNIRALCFGDVTLSKRELRSLVLATGLLEDFAYRGRNPMYPDAVSGQEIFETLALRKDTLKGAVVMSRKAEDHFTAGSKLTNLKSLVIEYDTFWKVSPDNTHLDYQALVGVFPPFLESISFCIYHEHFEGMREALINYILSNCAESPEEQKLKFIDIQIFGKAYDAQMSKPRSLIQLRNANARILRERVRKFMENGGRILMWSEVRYLVRIT
ncbi:hypothetical protein FSARC_13726 [Fusarium sarcochroum]|uniref:Uncharacterized protein n=1 Tax=Fusarium sarcochroum TaxID=1208366 RepID=A0A8H4SZC0_9HYPO|nr:hypothetical protein FSARC_13726 [Fusarium sarcochroum]